MAPKLLSEIATSVPVGALWSYKLFKDLSVSGDQASSVGGGSGGRSGGPCRRERWMRGAWVVELGERKGEMGDGSYAGGGWRKW